MIGIAANLLLVEGGLFPGLDRTYVNHDYVKAVELAGGIPLLLPVIQEEADIRRQLDTVDGVLLTGGYDVNPLCYGEDPHKDLGFIFPEVDDHQLLAARVAVETGKPVLGICRGMQVMNVAFGGTLYQDVSQLPTEVKHFQKAQRHVPSHGVNIVKDTILHNVFGNDKILINSFHHQAVKSVAPEFRVSAKAADGIIEAIEKNGERFAVGVQWHPEMMAQKHPAMLNLFRHFVMEAEQG